MASVNTQRMRVLRLYKRVLRLGREWQSKSGDEMTTEKERQYIFGEAKTQFRQNGNMNENEIEQKLKEGEYRMAIALHYKVPYPRPSNVPPMTMAKRIVYPAAKST